MGTRHLICVFYKGQFVLAQYGQHDGYPRGQGVTLVKFLQDSANIQQLKRGLGHTYEASDSEVYEAKIQIDKLDDLGAVAWHAFLEHRDPLIARGIMKTLKPSLHGSTGARILEVIAEAEDWVKVPIKLQLSFANDWLSCEWAYVIDLDAEVFEVFRGAEEKTPSHRFGDVGEGGDSVPSLISSFSFSELQEMKSEQDFLERLNEARCEESIAVRTASSNAAEYRADNRQEKRQTKRKRASP